MINVMDNVETYKHGKMNFVAGLCRKLNVCRIMDECLTKSNGRNPDIPYGTLAQMMIVNLCDNHQPLYLMKKYFEDIDLEGVFKANIDITQINDDRFANYLDRFSEAGPREIFSKLSSYAFAIYGLKIKKVNYDTTSKVMWGEYETSEGKIGSISIDFGHSKQKRGDKKQIKMGVGTANGIIVDAKVLSGNIDDKTYNHENLDDVQALLERTDTSKEDFYYIADCSLFTEKNIIKAKERGIKFITRVPETTKISKQLINKALSDGKEAEEIIFKNARNKEVLYKVKEYTADYRNVDCKFAVCYSKALEDVKNKSALKRIDKEKLELEKIIKQYEKRKFACETDALGEIEVIKKKIKKIEFHNLDFSIDETEKRRVGRPRKSGEESKEYTYNLNITFELDEEKLRLWIKKACTFVLVSNDTNISGTKILTEYKTQSSIENRFKQLKSPNFVNSLYLKTPERIEALTYMILISMMILSVAEHVVRANLKKENTIVIGPGSIKMKKPTLRSIVEIFYNIKVQVISEAGKKYRYLKRALNDSQNKILRYLGLDELIFI